MTTAHVIKYNGRSIIINYLPSSKEVSVQRALGLTIWNVYCYTAEGITTTQYRSIKIDAPSAFAAIQKIEEDNNWRYVYQVNEEIICSGALHAGISI